MTSPFDGTKILVVDDDFRNVFALTALLERGHAEVTVAESGAEALAALERDAGLRHRPDGHHDAGHGRLRHDARHPGDRPVRRRSRSSPSPARCGRRAPALPRRRRQRLRPQAGRHRRAARGLRPWLPAALGASRRRSPHLGRARSPGTRARRSTPATNAAEHARIDGLKVLVVDDDFRNIFAMTALLERGHAEVVGRRERRRGARAARAGRPDIDVVLMDIMMPVMDGYATIRAIRAIDSSRRFRSSPSPARSAAGERQRCLDAGANDYVPKPVDTAELLAALRPLAAGDCGADERVLRSRTGASRCPRAPRPVPVLVVDDNPAKRLALMAVLAPLGYAIVEADSGVGGPALRHRAGLRGRSCSTSGCRSWTASRPLR